VEVVWKPRALQQREQIHAAIARQINPEQAHKTLVAIKRATDRLEQHPDYGLATDKPGLRVILVPRTPYRVFYRRGRQRCEILRIEDARRGAPLRKK
jgi:plasmid stabilization system protein ParE